MVSTRRREANVGENTPRDEAARELFQNVVFGKIAPNVGKCLIAKIIQPNLKRVSVRSHEA